MKWIVLLWLPVAALAADWSPVVFRSWQVRGPIPAAGLGQGRAVAAKLAWQEAKVRSDGHVDLAALFPDTQMALAVARTEFTAAAGEWLFAVGSDDGVSVQLNGEEIWRHDVGRGYRARQDQFRAQVKEGANELVVLVHQRVGDWGFGVVGGPAPSRRPLANLRIEAHDQRVDLVWESAVEPDVVGYRVEVAKQAAGPFETLVERTKLSCWSHFLGVNDVPRHYRVSKRFADGTELAGTPPVSATPRAMTEEELLGSVQGATFRYFWDYGHPVSGLARERLGSRDTCTIGGSGFSLMAMCVAAERGFVPRAAVAERVLRMVSFLQDRATRYHGAWAHWVNGRTGATRGFGKFDDGADLVETAFLVQGLLTVRQYFAGDTAAEREIRKRTTTLWREVEWDWFHDPEAKQLRWHWSPKHGWKMNHRLGGHFNEGLIVYLLAGASPTHPIPPESYRDGWIRNPEKYLCGKMLYGIRQAAGWPRGGPLFFTHYSFLGFDPRNWHDGFCNYFENNRAISLIHRAYCIENPRKQVGYAGNCWGLTASDGPDGYRAHAPGRIDTGTIAPTAALSAMAYTPLESKAALRHFYYDRGKAIWGPFGFWDAFNPGRDWVAKSYLAIDQGPIIVMIENARTQLCWRLFMRNPEIAPALLRMGWKQTP